MEFHRIEQIPMPDFQSSAEAVRVVEEGIAAARAQRWETGFTLIGQAYRSLSRGRDAETLAAALSYYGLCLAMHKGRTKEGADYCELALEKEFFRADFYWNLAQVWIRAGRRRKAVEAIERGLAIDPHNRSLVEVRDRIGVRRSPVLSFLDRDNPLNVSLGKVRASIKTKPGPTVTSR